MKLFLILIILVPVFFSCNHPYGSAGDHYQLTESALYDIDSVRAALGTGSPGAAGKKLLEAINLYKNKKDPERSIPIFKGAILLNPSAKAYFELGSALLDNEQYEGAISALHIAEQLDYSPLANVMYKLSAAYANTPGEHSKSADSVASHYMEVALQMGYAHPAQFRTDKSFALMKGYYLFNKTYKNALSGNGGSKDPDKMLWENFKSEFKPVALPLTINTVWIQNHSLENSIGYDYEKFVPEMRSAKFSREVENDYYYFATVKKDTAYTALLYAGKNNFLLDANQHSPVVFFLVTYDGNGKIIDKMPVAGQKAFTDVFKVFTLKPNYTFEVKDYKNIFKDDPEKDGYDSNYVVRSEPLGTANYRIAVNGKFEKTDAPLAISFPPNRSGSASLQ